MLYNDCKKIIDKMDERNKKEEHINKLFKMGLYNEARLFIKENNLGNH